MNEEQARRLGELVRTARKKKGLSQYALADLTEVDFSWLARLEAGRYASPNPAQLARVAETLEIDPARIDRISHNQLAASMPSMRTYFRSKEKLSTEALDAIERALTDIRAQDAQRRTSKPLDGDRS